MEEQTKEMLKELEKLFNKVIAPHMKPFEEHKDYYEVCETCDEGNNIQKYLQNIEDVLSTIQGHIKKEIFLTLCEHHKDERDRAYIRSKINYHESQRDEWESAAMYLHNKKNETT